MTGRRRRSRLRFIPVLLALVAAACGPAPEPVPAPDVPEETAPAPGPGARVRFADASAMEALAPFGMLRVAPVLAVGDAPALRALRHTRGTLGGVEDFWLSATVPGAPSLMPATVAAAPGYLAIDPVDQGPRLESTSSGRVAFHRITVVPGEPVEIDLAWRPPGADVAARETLLEPARGRRALTGSLHGGDGVTLHVAVRFDRSFQVRRETDREEETGAASLGLRFEPPPGGVLLARIAFSTVDVAAARANLDELGHWDFDAAVSRVRAAWDRVLGRLSVSGEAAGRERLTTALYHVFAHYGDITDLDGRYRAGDGAVRRVPRGSAFIGNLDLDPESRALIPLLSLLAPERMDDLADGLLAQQRIAGALPSRTLWGRTVADAALVPAVPVLASLAVRRLPDFDAGKALPPLIKAGSIPGPDAPWDIYSSRGYFPYDRVPRHAVSQSLAAARAHHGITAVAASLGERSVAEAFATRALFYRQLWDTETGLFRGRDSERRWRRPFTPGDLEPAAAADYEGNDPWSALWAPGQFDEEGLLTLLGGREALARRLNAYFDGPAGGSYDHARPSLHHVPWLYVYSNEPGRAGERVRDLLVAGGGEGDACRSAWRVFATLGLYPLNPTRGDYVLVRPSVASAGLRIGQRTLIIDFPGLATAGPLDAVSFDGSRLAGRTVSHGRLAGGGVLRFEAAEDAGGEPAQ